MITLRAKPGRPAVSQGSIPLCFFAELASSRYAPPRAHGSPQQGVVVTPPLFPCWEGCHRVATFCPRLASPRLCQRGGASVEGTSFPFGRSGSLPDNAELRE